MKKALALILSLAMVLCLVPAVASADVTTIADVRAAGIGETFTVEGVMTAKDGKSLYIQDATAGIVVRVSDDYLDDALVGMKITATGTTGDFNGLRQLNAPSSAVTFVETTDVVTPVNAEFADLATMIAQQVKLTNWKITAIDDVNPSGGYYSSPNITITDGTNSLMMYKSMVTKANFEGCEGATDPIYKVGDAVNVIVTVDCYNALRLRLDGDAHIEKYVEETPATEPPATEPPATEPPATEPPATEPPATEPPATEPPVVDDKNTEDLVVLYSNDVHCGIEDGIGYAGVAGYKKAMLEEYANVMLVDAGDHVQGAPIGTISTGSYIVDIMNFVGYDLAAVGNHEFDYGMDRFFQLNDMAEYEYISANFMNLETNEAVLDAYKVVTFGDKKVAFVGLSTPETLTKSTPTYFQNAEGEWIYGFAHSSVETFVATIQAAIDAAAAEADYVIAIGHLGVDPASSPWTSQELIAQVSGLSAFIDGHSHSTVACEIVKDKDDKDVTLTQTGTKLANLGKMILKADGTVTCELINAAEKDEETVTFINAIKAQYEGLLNTVVAHTNFNLYVNDPATATEEAPLGTVRMVRSRETNLGDLCADAYRDQLDADIAFVNGGGVRDSIPKGDITYNQIIKVHPFGNVACLVEVTGQQILDALEWGYKECGVGENGGFLQVSGLTCKVNTAVANGCQVDADGFWAGQEGEYRVFDVMVGGQPLDLNAKYTLASHNYMLKSQGDGYAMFGTANVTMLRDEVMIDNQVLINYIQKTLNGEITSAYRNAYGQGRITIGDFDYADYYLEAATGMETEFEKDANGNLIYTLKLSDLGTDLISSLEFDIKWDATQLELKSIATTPIYYMDPMAGEKIIEPNINANGPDGNAPIIGASEFYYATATSRGGYFKADSGNVVATFMFKILDTVEDGTKMDIAFTKIQATFSDSRNVLYDVNNYTVAAYDGYIVAGGSVVDKTALEALIAADDAIMANEDLEISPDGKDLAAGTLWLTEAQKTANEAALAAAKLVLADADATQAEVDAAYDALIAAFVKPAVAAVDTKALEAAIAAAEAAKADEEGWNAHGDKWQANVEAALEAAQAALEAAASQNAVDEAAAELLAALGKTGEGITYVVFAGIALMAIIGLAVVVKRRFN